MVKICLIIPVFNEAAIVKKVWTNFFFRLNYSIILVDDGSTDDTSRMVSVFRYYSSGMN